MKIISSTQLKELDKYTIAKEPIASIDLMERAAEELTRAITHRWDTSFHIAVFAGPGNNGGDALAVARMLSKQNYHVEVFLFNTKGKLSEECQTNLERLKEYTYHLKTSEKTPGIITAEDWIAFSQLINSNTFTQYKGKTLDDFGETMNGITIYYLLNDIDFKDVDCTELKQIGYAQTNYYFSQIFDGQNHTLYNIPINSSNGTTGVFGAVNITGIVKNLHIESSKVSITSKSKSTAEGTSILVGRNKGKILNCFVKECQITANPTKTNQSANTGGIAGTSTGEITNCYVTNTQIVYDADSKIKAEPAGGIAGSIQTQGLITNCYSANNIIKNRESYNGGICGKALDGAHIENCYVYNIDLITTKGLFAGIAANSFFIHNYYDNAKITFIGKNDSGNQLSKNAQYTGTFINKENIPIYQLLNQWINETAPTLYPGYLFTRWTDGGENLPAVFISETQKSK